MAEQTVSKPMGGGPARPAATKPVGGAVSPSPAPVAKPTIKWPEIVFKGESVPSSIHKDLRHLFVVAGFYGTGKTTFALGAEEPENILMLDYESKGEMIAGQLGVENYFPISQEVSEAQGTANYAAINIYRRTRQILEAVPKDRFTLLVLDGLTILQDGCVEQIEDNPTAYGCKAKNVETGSFGGAFPGVNVVLNQLFTKAREKGIKLIGVTTELKSKWGKEGPIFNKFEKKGTSIIDKMSVLSVILGQPGYPKYGGAPYGLVLKEQLALYTRENGRQKVIKRIPPKLPCATFDAIYAYLDGKLDYGKLREEEIPTKEEIGPFTPVVDKSQLDAMMAFLKLQQTMGTEEG